MGKTIRLTEEQIRRFFGEGFGKRLLGEGADIITNDPPGQATYTGNLNRARFDYTGGKDSDLTTAARANKMQLGNSRMSQYTVNDIFKNNKENTGGKIDEIVKQISDFMKTHTMNNARWRGIEILDCNFGSEYCRLFKILIGNNLKIQLHSNGIILTTGKAVPRVLHFSQFLICWHYISSISS